MKKVLALILALAMFLPLLTACSELGDLTNLISNVKDLAGDWEKFAEARKELTNYKITIEQTNSAGEKSTITEMRCEDGYANITSNKIVYVEYESGKYYYLDTTEKTGTVMEMDVVDTYKDFGLIISGYTLLFNAARLIAKEDGSDKILGRKTTCYTYDDTENNNTQKFWLDDEYGIVMRYISTSTDGMEPLEVTEFTKGGVKLSDMVNINDYQITDSSVGIATEE